MRYLVSPVVFDDYEKAVAEATRQAEKRMAEVRYSDDNVAEVRVQVWALAGEIIVSRPKPTTRFEKAS